MEVIGGVVLDSILVYFKLHVLSVRIVECKDYIVIDTICDS